LISDHIGLLVTIVKCVQHMADPWFGTST